MPSSVEHSPTGGSQWPLIGVVVPAPSEPFTWKKTWPWERVCSLCGRELRTQDVGEHRTVYGDDGRVAARFLWCKDHRGGRL